MSAVEGADLGPADEPYDPEWVRALIDDRAQLQVEVETLQRQADMYRALARKRDTAFAERLTQRVAEDRGLLDRVEAGPAEGMTNFHALYADLCDLELPREQPAEMIHLADPVRLVKALDAARAMTVAVLDVLQLCEDADRDADRFGNMRSVLTVQVHQILRGAE